MLQRCEISQNVGYQPDISARKKINYQVWRELLISGSWHIKGAAKIVCLQKTGPGWNYRSCNWQTQVRFSPNSLLFYFLVTWTSHISSSSINVQVRPPQGGKRLAALTVRRNWISSSPSPPSAILHRGLLAAPLVKAKILLIIWSRFRSRRPSFFSPPPARKLSLFWSLDPPSWCFSQRWCVGVLEDHMSPVTLTDLWEGVTRKVRLPLNPLSPVAFQPPTAEGVIYWGGGGQVPCFKSAGAPIPLCRCVDRSYSFTQSAPWQNTHRETHRHTHVCGYKRNGGDSLEFVIQNIFKMWNEYFCVINVEQISTF